jgi:hypothetical protein
MIYDIAERELVRFEIQRTLDSSKDLKERNVLGQYPTPYALAEKIMRRAISFLVPRQKIEFIEPALSTGVFYSALLRTVEETQLSLAVGVEIDDGYVRAANGLWCDTGLQVVEDDFIRFSQAAEYAKRFNLLVTNPPYVRHHHLLAKYKSQLGEWAKSAVGFRPSGLSGLYVYFMLMADHVLADDAIAAWLIPSEFLTVNYGSALRRYLKTQVELLEIHQFDAMSVQFDDALVSSSVVIYRKRTPLPLHKPLFYFSGVYPPTNESLIDVAFDGFEQKWTLRPARKVDVDATAETRCIGDLFQIRRGIATGNNEFFLVNNETIRTFSIPPKFLLPILPSPRYLKTSTVERLDNGEPALSPATYLLCCDQPPDVVQNEFPGLWRYLQVGMEREIDKGYLCANRDVWYYQEKRAPAPILITYMGRQREETSSPVRFILNYSNAVATNVYLNLYPKPYLAALLRDDSSRLVELYQLLQKISVASIISGGREYGGGLHKVEPKELAAIELTPLPQWLGNQLYYSDTYLQSRLFE